MKRKKCILFLFIAIEAVLYAFILRGGANTYIFCYTSIAICFATSVLFFFRDKHWLIMFVALACTLVADTFLVLLHAENQIAGMLAFNCTQIAYAIKIGLDSSKTKTISSVVVRCVLIITLEIVAFVVLRLDFSLLIFIVLIYFSNLIVNTIFAFATKSINWLFAVGLVLFVLCDINVGLPTLSHLVDFAEDSLICKFLDIDFNFIWLFYLPSQVLLTTSILPYSSQINVNK